MIAFELDGQADGGSNEGTYLELGVAPAWSLAEGKAILSVPTKLGLSLDNYYEGPDGDEKFGDFQIGSLVTAPFTSATSKFGVWSVKGGVDVYAFGDTPKAFYNGDSAKVVRRSECRSLTDSCEPCEPVNPVNPCRPDSQTPRGCDTLRL